MPTRFVAFLIAMLLAVSAHAQTNQHPYNFTAATSPLPTGSCFWLTSPGSDRSLCSNWAPAIGAWSAAFDAQSGDSVFALPAADAFKIVYRTNHTPQADTISSPATTGFGSGFGVAYFSVPQGNSINPLGGALFNNQAGYTFGANQGALLFSDGANYRSIIGLPTGSSQDSTQFLGNDNIFRQVGQAQLAPGAVTTPALASGLTLTSPTITLGSDAPGDLYVRGTNGQLTPLGVGAANTVLAVNAGACTTDGNNVTTCAPNAPGYQATLSSTVLPIATNAANGAGRPDGTTISIDAGGSYHVPLGIDSVTTGITALGTSQATCASLTTRANYITTVTAGSGVCMPGLVKGAHYFVCNKTTTPVLVYAPADGSIISTPTTGPLASTQAVSVGRGCPEFIAESTSSLWVTGAGVPLTVQ